MDSQLTGNRIATLRRELGMTQRQLAEQLHVTDKAVSKWERGINFPDLGLMERLSQALNTTPAYLLGLEQANQSETLCALAEISQEQLEESQKDVAFLGWGSIGSACLLCIGKLLARQEASRLFPLFSILILVLANVGLYFLFRCGQIKKWGPKELGTFWASLSPILIWLGFPIFTGGSLHPAVITILAVISVLFTQIHFLRVMKPKLMQLLPLVLSLLLGAWRAIMGSAQVTELLLPVVCLVVVLLHGRKHPGFWQINWADAMVVLIFLLILILILCWLCWPMVARCYLLSDIQRIRAYSLAQLAAGGTADHFGMFEVEVYPELGLVKFNTGGSGLVPESTYEGLYFSASGDHVCFPGFVPAGDFDSTAWFRDSEEASDNWQKSTHITGNFFWFVLHY